jgi:hypothetical protein
MPAAEDLRGALSSGRSRRSHRQRHGRWMMRVALVVLASVVVSVTGVQVAEAVTGTPSSDGRPTVCGDDGRLESGADGTAAAYGSTWVAPGATVTLTGSGEITPSTYVGNGRCRAPALWDHPSASGMGPLHRVVIVGDGMIAA